MVHKIEILKREARRSNKNQNDGESITLAFDISCIDIIKDRFIFDTRSGKFHRASESAAFILKQLKLSTPIPEIVTRYAGRYGVVKAIAERDVELFLNDMSVVGMPVRAHEARATDPLPRRRQGASASS